jgi:hypothetical protein
MPHIYKLKYTNKETALTDLIAKGVYIQTEEGQAYGNGVQAVVELGIIMLEPPTFDEEGNELTPAVYADGYHYDVMSTEMYDFGANLIEPKNPKHAFAGYPITQEV